MHIAYCLQCDSPVGVPAAWLADHHRHVLSMLRRHGHDVTVFGPGNGLTDVDVVVDSPDHLIERVYSRSDSYDVIQWYAADWPLDVASRCPTPTVITATIPVEDREYFGGVALVPVSGAISAAAPSLPWLDVIPIAVDVYRYTYNPVGGVGLIWVGDDSGGRTAAYRSRQIAARAEVPLQVISGERLNHEPDLLGDALGLVCDADGAISPYVAAALASGTPLLALQGSAATGAVVDGETGWVVQTVEDAANRVPDLCVVSRRLCRREAEHRFSPLAVVSAYELLYRTLLPALQAVPETSVLLGAHTNG